MNVFSRGIRNAFRNTTRSIALVLILGLGLGLSLSMLVANKAVSDRIATVKASVGNTIAVTPAGFNGFSSVNNALSSSQLGGLTSLSHVSSVSQDLTDRLTTNGSQSLGRFGSNSTSGMTSLTSPVSLNTTRFFVNGGGGGGAAAELPSNFSLPISIVGTTDPTHLNSAALTISSGQNIKGQTDMNQAIVSQAMATKNNLKVGSSFSAYNTNLTVSGIFVSPSSNRAADDTVVVSLPTEQRLSGQGGDITSATVYVDSLDNLSSTTTAVKNKLGSSADVVSAVDQANQATQPLNSVKSISLYSLIGAAIAASIIILMTMIMIVRERRREIGVLKAIGATNRKIVSQFTVEAVTLTLLAAVVGIILGVLAASPITRLLVNNASSTPGMGMGRFGGGGGGGGGFIRSAGAGRGNLATIHAAIGWSVVVYGLLIALAIAVVASSLTSLVISKIRPAEVMRSE